jgi:hypothetical protein
MHGSRGLFEGEQKEEEKVRKDRILSSFQAIALCSAIFQARSRITRFNLLILPFFYPKKTSLSIGPKGVKARYKGGFAARQLDRHKRKIF